jgi:hypothetical protein
MKLKEKILVIFIIIGLLLFVFGCEVNKNEENTGGKIQLIISKDFGKETIFKKKVDYKNNITVMDILFDAGADIKTSYGGSFISGINGLLSDSGGVTGERKDWFYYVNGIFADVGVLDYFLEPGEVVWWDYHPWKMAMGGATAVVGFFPEPFLHGYMGKKYKTYLMSFPEEKDMAQNLKEKLNTFGVKEIEIVDVKEDLLKERKGPTIFLGEWEKLKKIDFVKEINSNYKKNGTSLHFTDNTLELLDYKGNVAKVIQEKAGIIAALGEGSGDVCPLWIISGIDSEGFSAAVNVLINNPEKISVMYSAVVSSGSNKIMSLPLLGE